jgi:hypothetical protein
MTIAAVPLRRRVRGGLIVALVVSLIVALHAVWDYVERRRLVSAIEAIQQRGEPVQMPVRAPTSRAGVQYAAAALLTVGLSDVWALSDMAPLDNQRTGEVGTSDAGRIRTVLESGRMALTLADQAARVEFDGLPPGTDFAYRTASLAALTRLIALRTHALAAEGHGDESARSAMTGLAVRSAADQNALVLGHTSVGGVLSAARPGREMLHEWQAALERAEDPERVERTLRDARARYLELVWRHAFGPSPDTPRHQTLPMRGVVARLWRPWLARQITADLREWADVIAIAGRPPAERATLLEPLEIERRQQPPPSVFASGRWFMGLSRSGAWPLLGHAVRHDTLALDRAGRVALAIERYRRDHDDALPTSLDALVPAYLTDVPLDPFNDGPLLYRSTPSGYVVYSVGANGTDDGGDVRVPPQERGPSGLLFQPRSRDEGVVVEYR